MTKIGWLGQRGSKMRDVNLAVTSLVIGIVGIAALGITTGAKAYDLNQHAWRDRLLIVAAPDARSTEVRRQLEAIADRSPAVLDRRLRVITLHTDKGQIDGTPLRSSDVAQLRRQFGITPQEQSLLLIGLDGGIKRRAPLGTELSELFTQIDAMPMRQAEIKAKRASGQPVTSP